MKILNLILLLFAIVIIKPLIAQEQKDDYVSFPMENAEWINFRNVPEQDIKENTRYYTANETINILGNTFYKILFDGYCAYNEFYIRETEDRKVLAVFPQITELMGYEVEVLLYDFGVEVGDTIFFDFQGDIYGGGCGYFNRSNDCYYVIKEIKDYYLYNGEKRKAYYLSYRSSNNISGVWVEGLGSSNLLLGVYGDDIQFSDYCYLTCFYHNNELLYKREGCENCTCIYYYINAFVNGYGGSIEPNGYVKVPKNYDQSFIITPDEGFYINEVLIDGMSNQQAVEAGQYTFINVFYDQTIEVLFDYLSIEDYSYGISIYPNPATSILKIESLDYQIKSINISNISG
ncbi:MAG: hypothetical protein LBP67_07120 [Bacteroidales bacterium]|jgi:hypothetical protein|nr:hypothetical protein [Bacteroidales bacterium]